MKLFAATFLCLFLACAGMVEIKYDDLKESGENIDNKCRDIETCAKCQVAIHTTGHFIRKANADLAQCVWKSDAEGGKCGKMDGILRVGDLNSRRVRIAGYNKGKYNSAVAVLSCKRIFDQDMKKRAVNVRKTNTVEGVAMNKYQGSEGIKQKAEDSLEDCCKGICGGEYKMGYRECEKK